MLSKKNIKNNLPAAFLCVVSILIIYYFFTNKLNRYIHPRYIDMTLVAAIATIAIIAYGSRSKKTHTVNLSKFTLGPVIIILFLVLLLPARTLKSVTVNQREVTTVATNTSNIISSSSKNYSILDWSNLLKTNKNIDFYNNKTATISGFVVDGDLGNDAFLLARFKVTCCAVDAQPVTVPVYSENWKQNFAIDSWVEIQASVSKKNSDDGEMLMLTPSSINSIKEPKQPYVD